MFETIEPPPLNQGVKLALVLWCVLAPFWAVLSLGAAAFRTNVGGNLYAISWALYPLLLWIAFLFKRLKPYLAALPTLSFVAMYISGAIDNLLRHASPR